MSVQVQLGQLTGAVKDLTAEIRRTSRDREPMREIPLISFPVFSGPCDVKNVTKTQLDEMVGATSLHSQFIQVV